MSNEEPKIRRRLGRVSEGGLVEWTTDTVDRALNVFATAKEDGWVNVLSGLGIASRDKREGGTLRRARRLAHEPDFLEELFYSDDLAARYVKLPAHEMTREWIDVKIDGDVDAASGVMQRLEELGAKKAVTDALIWARLYGGSVVLLGVDDGQEMDQPLDDSAVRSLDFLTVMDRHDVQTESFYTDPSVEKYGEVESYRIVGSVAAGSVGYGQIVHESRVLRFDGVLTGRRRRRENNGWSESVLTDKWRVLRDYQMSMDGVSHLLQDFSQAVFRIKGLAKMLASDKDSLVLQRLKMLDISRSIVRAVPLDEGEEFERKGTPVSGMSDLIDRQMMRVSAATNIPVTLFFGRSPAGMNATGESDVRLFYDHIAGAQESDLRNPLERLTRLIMLGGDGPTRGVEPESWSLTFNPLYQESAKEKAETRKLIAETDKIYADLGAVMSEEIRASRFGGDVFSPETTLDDAAYEASKAEEEAKAEERAAQLAALSQQQQQQRGEPRGGPDADDERGDGLVRLQRADGSDPGYRLRRPDADGVRDGLCSLCSHAVEGGICARFGFAYAQGHTCDDYDVAAR